MTDLDQTTASGLSRRTVVKGAAWSVPAIALAVAAPAASASVVDVNVGDFSVDGTCGVLGLLLPGYTVEASATAALPVGTVITVSSDSVLSLDVLSLTGATADIALLDGGNTATITLTSELPAGQTANLRTLASVNVATSSSATLTLPTGYVAGAGAKDTGSLSTTLIFCNAS
jgi:hypothetical protein